MKPSRKNNEEKQIIICGDFNAKISGYDCRVSNLGGEELKRIAALADLKIANSKEEPTRRE